MVLLSLGRMEKVMGVWMAKVEGEGPVEIEAFGKKDCISTSLQYFS